jgi:hypothetical protein
MNHDHRQQLPHDQDRTPFRAKWVFLGFALVAAYFLITEHTAHLKGWLASYGIWLLLLACPLMHFFMHGSHGGHGGHGSHDRDRADAGTTPDEQRREQSK